MLRDDLAQFLIEVSNIYPIGKDRNYDHVINITVDYLLESLWGKKINYNNALKYIIDNYGNTESGMRKGALSFPNPPFIKEALLKNQIYETNVQKEKLDVVIQILPSGEIREYIDVGYGTPIERLQQQGKVLRFPQNSKLNWDERTVTKPDGTVVNLRG